MYKKYHSLNAPVDAKKTELGQNSKQAKPTQSNDMHNPQYRLRGATVAEIVPMVIADFLGRISDPNVGLSPTRLEADQRCLMSILGELNGIGSRQ